MHKIIYFGVMLASISCPLKSNPIIDSDEVPYQLRGSKLDFAELNNLDQAHLLQNLPTYLDKRTLGDDMDDLFNKEGLSLGAYAMDDGFKEGLFGKHPRISLLNRLQSKERKQYKKRGNLSECFWKYCV
ncbi:urotensin-2-like [Spea bombifrons]|uniref:urotensin-2-like n=1 Tax=Spea bombifrons TaxID=233779 RepID=UPI002349E371|nr:urotensin-2-like [Spea bombifrons]